MFKVSNYQDYCERKVIASQLQDDKTARQIWHVSNDRIEKIYQFACDLYDSKHYSDSSDLFLLLATLDPIQPMFWKGLGFASQKNGDFLGAIVAYEEALSLETHNAELYPYYLRSLCEGGKKEQALVVFKEFLDMCHKHTFHNYRDELGRIRSQAEKVMRNCIKGES